MQKLFVHILAILRRHRPPIEAAPAVSSQRAYRAPRVSRAPEPNVYLKVLSPAERRRLSPRLTASIGTIVVAGFAGPAMAQGDEACAFVYELRSAYTVELVLQRFPNDPCIPVLLDALSPSLLRQVDVDIVRALPASQLRKVQQEVLQQLGIQAGTGATTRAVPRTTYRAPPRNGPY